MVLKKEDVVGQEQGGPSLPSLQVINLGIAHCVMPLNWSVVHLTDSWAATASVRCGGGENVQPAQAIIKTDKKSFFILLSFVFHSPLAHFPLIHHTGRPSAGGGVAHKKKLCCFGNKIRTATPCHISTAIQRWPVFLKASAKFYIFRWIDIIVIYPISPLAGK